MRASRTAKGAKAKADKLFSLIVRSRGACIKCGSTENLQTMHIISRRYAHTRCDLDNAMCGCARCHHYFTDHPVEFGQFVVAEIGADYYRYLTDKANRRTKVDWDAEVERLTKIWQAIEAAA